MKSLISGLGLAIVCLTPAAARAQANPPTLFAPPEWKSSDGSMSVRMRGRWQHDFYDVETDFDGVTRDSSLRDDETRNIRIGLDATIGPKLTFRAEGTLLNSQFNWLDLYATYRTEHVDVTLGQQYVASALEGSITDAALMFPEASQGTIAFGMRTRSVGLIGRYKGKDWQAVGGYSVGNVNPGDIFGDDVATYWQARVSRALRNKPGDVLHIGANLRLRDARSGPRLRYRARSTNINYGPRLLDTTAIGQDDTTFGLEALLVHGPWSVSGEHLILEAQTPSGRATFNASYVEASYWLTGEVRGYRAQTGNFVLTRPKRSLLRGGPGGVGLAVRAERLDLSDAPSGAAPLPANPAGISRGESSAISAALVWLPVDYWTVRLTAAHTRFEGQAAGFGGKGRTDTLAAKVQFSF